MVPKPLIIPLSSSLMLPVSGTLEHNQREISPLIDRQKKVHLFCSFMIAVWSSLSLVFFPLFTLALSLSDFSSLAPVCDRSPFILIQLHLSFSLFHPFSSESRPIPWPVPLPIIHSDRKGEGKALWGSGWQRDENGMSFKAAPLNNVYKSAQFDWNTEILWHYIKSDR